MSNCLKKKKSEKTCAQSFLTDAGIIKFSKHEVKFIV